MKNFNKGILLSCLSTICMTGYASTNDCTDGHDGKEPTCIIFITPHDHDGDFNGNARDGYDGANKYCNQEAQSAEAPVEVRNLYANGIRFRAYLGGNIYGSTDKNTSYYWPNQTTKIATTDNDKNFPTTLTNPIGDPAMYAGTSYWLGINNGGGNVDDNCDSYTAKYHKSGGSKHNYYGITGNFEVTNWSNGKDSSRSCGAGARLACIAIVHTDVE